MKSCSSWGQEFRCLPRPTFLDLCIRDAVALAEDVQMNVDAFNEKKCQDYLRLIEPSIEKLTRNQGVAERKVSDFLERLSATTA